MSGGGFAWALQRRKGEIKVHGAAAFIDADPDEVGVTIHDCPLVREPLAGAAEAAVRRV